MMHDLQVRSIHSVSIGKVLGGSVLKYLQILKRTLGAKKETFMLKSLSGLFGMKGKPGGTLLNII